ncbi:MAG: hypothetical protein H6807_01000 [Planctomycetes bacterium]|nr:hypothetical protein [Planctomycetota bacterium]
MNRCVIIPIVILGLAVLGGAQVVYVLDPGLPTLMEEVYLPSTLHPIGGPGYHGVIPLPATAAFPPTPPTGGGIAFDQSTSRVFATDGVTIVTDYCFAYAPFVAPTAPPPPAPVPPFPAGAITGMGTDVLAGLLWLTDGFNYGAAALGFPFPIAIPPLPLPFPLLGGPLVGLDFDQATGSLWACDAVGNVYNWLPGGGVIGPQPVATVPGLPLPLGGLAINDTNGAGSIGPHFCSLQLQGYHVLVSDGFQVFDALNPLNPPLPTPSPTGLGIRGLAVSCDPQIIGGTAAVASAGLIGFDKATTTNPGAANALRLVGAKPLTTALFLYDLCPIPGGLASPVTGETLWINPLSPTFAFGVFVTDALGNVSHPLSFAFAPVGLNFVGQWAIFQPMNPLGYALTDAMQFCCGTN